MYFATHRKISKQSATKYSRTYAYMYQMILTFKHHTERLLLSTI